MGVFSATPHAETYVLQKALQRVRPEKSLAISRSSPAPAVSHQQTCTDTRLYGHTLRAKSHLRRAPRQTPLEASGLPRRAANGTSSCVGSRSSAPAANIHDLASRASVPATKSSKRCARDAPKHCSLSIYLACLVLRLLFLK